MESKHQFIEFETSPTTGMNTFSSFLVVNHYLAFEKQTRAKWKKDKRKFTVNWTGNNGDQKHSIPLNYLSIAKFIRENEYFDASAFNLPLLECFWLDHSLDIKLNFHMSDNTGTLGLVSGVPQQQFGERYPIKPKLEREGHLYTAFLPQLLNRIINLRTRLINGSENAESDEWVFELRTLIVDTISLLEISLNQFYIKAEYDPLGFWDFKKEVVGERHNRRLSDKLKWVYQISGNFLNIEQELKSLNTLRELRNHMMHFDPPSLIVTFEEASNWLNSIIDIGHILVKIRQAIGVEMSSSLIKLILQRKAKFQPRNIRPKRKKISNEKLGDYYSSVWPTDIEKGS